MSARATILSLLALPATCVALFSCASRSHDSGLTPAASTGQTTASASNPAAKPVFFPITRATDSSPEIAEQKVDDKQAQASAPAPAGPGLFPGTFQGFGTPGPSPFTKAMGDIAQIHENIIILEKGGWAATGASPDPAAQAEKMAQALAKLIDSERSKKKPADFAAMMKNSSDQAAALKVLLSAAHIDAKQATAQLAIVAKSCDECHTKYRD